MATKYTRRAVAWTFGSAVFVLASACNSTTIRVIRQDGAPVAGAEVFANQARIGQTDANGVLAFPLARGDTLVARKQIFERPGYRQHHDPEHHRPEDGQVSWTARVYLSSMAVSDEGVLLPWDVIDPAIQQTLVLRTDNTLIGLHFMVSVIWDASGVELAEIGRKFQDAGEYMYNATDGQ